MRNAYRILVRKPEGMPPLWSSDESSCLQMQRSRVRFLALSDFLRSSGSGTGPTQPRDDNWGAPVKKTELMAGGDPLRWPRDTLYPQKLALTSTTSGGRSVGIVRLRTRGHGVKPEGKGKHVGDAGM
jgi:hypothetical protein